MGSDMRIGIDLGGTKIEIIAIARTGATLLRRRVHTPKTDYARIVRTIGELVDAAEVEIGERATVGVATPGAISPKSGLIKNSNSTVLNGKPLQQNLEEALGRPVRIENDANCFALSEAVDGAATEANVVFGVILGTGVGGGLVIGKQIVGGRNKIAGEWGHTPLPWASESERPGPACYCGKSGCVETFLSGPGFARSFRGKNADVDTPEKIVAAATAGNADAQACLQTYRDRLARGLAAVVNIIDPDTIVLGGGVSNIEELYGGLPDLVARYAFSDAVDTAIVPALHGDSSGVRGAAWLWPAEA
jgi:fructokinase